jgi:hypothetical protein
MNRHVLVSICLVAAAAIVVLSCDGLFPFVDDFEPTGTPFYLNPSIAVKGIAGSLRHFSPYGQFALDMVGSSSSPVSDTLPAGLLFTSLTPLNRVQHMLMLKPHALNAGTETLFVLGVFCCNERREIPDDLDSFDLGPTTDHSGLQELAGLVHDKDISGHLGMVQRAVWLITDSTGLNQVYRDSIDALPPATGGCAVQPGDFELVEPGFFERVKRLLSRQLRSTNPR